MLAGVAGGISPASAFVVVAKLLTRVAKPRIPPDTQAKNM